MEHARAHAADAAEDAGRKQAHSTVRALLGVARHWVKPNGRDDEAMSRHEAQLVALQSLGRRLKVRKTGLSARNRALLRYFDDPVQVDRFYALPALLIRSLSGINAITVAHARTFQLAVMLEVLQMMPIRIKNLSELNIGTNFIRARTGQWQIILGEGETKNTSEFVAVLPMDSSKMIDTYIDRYRPILLGANAGAWLFPGRVPGHHKSVGALRHQICEGTRRHLGPRFNPHAFRHIAAKVYLEANPGAYGVVQHMLGHNAIETTIDNYCGSEAPKAIAAFHDLVLKRREVVAQGQGRVRASKRKKGTA
jgi:integrase